MCTQDFERITVEQSTESIASCNCCGRRTYKPEVRETVELTGLVLYDLGITSNCYQTSITKLCADCIKALRAKLFPFSA